MGDIVEITREIVKLVQSEKNQWLKIYKIVQRAEDNETYKPEYKTARQWELALCKTAGLQLRELQRYKDAGRQIDEYNAARMRAGKQTKTAESVHVSPRNVETVRKISAGSPQKRDQLLTAVLDGKIGHRELDQMWKTAKASGVHVRTSRHDKMGTSSAPSGMAADPRKITAADIVLTLQKTSPAAWIPEPVRDVPKVYNDPNRFRVFTEFPVKTGAGTVHAARMDALVVETFGTEHWNDVILHGMEIKINEYDLMRDVKMMEYTDFCDYFWIVCPVDLVDAAAQYAGENGGDDWGILAVTDDIRADGIHGPILEPYKKPERLPGLMRHRTLETIVHKYAI